jgi:spore germination protein GerM
MTEGRQPFTAEIKTLAKGPSTYDPLENSIDVNRTLRSRPSTSRSGHMPDLHQSAAGSIAPQKRAFAGRQFDPCCLFYR